MFKLDNTFLEELGLGALPPAEKNKMLAHIYETLEMRVGMKLAEQMSNEQLDEFESFINKQDEAGALKWLESNFPNYKQVVAEQLDILKAEISQVAPQIVAQSQQNAMQQPSQSQQSTPQQHMQPQPQQSIPQQPPATSSSQDYTNPQTPPQSHSQPSGHNYQQQMPPTQPQPWRPE